MPAPETRVNLETRFFTGLRIRQRGEVFPLESERLRRPCYGEDTAKGVECGTPVPFPS
jgi:hypothetical protein